MMKIGVLGGGQLGKMLGLSAAELGLTCAFFEKSADVPVRIFRDVVCAPFEEEPLLTFAKECDFITYEWENVPAQLLCKIEELLPGRLRPHPTALITAQDRLLEKKLISSLGVGTAPFAPVTSLREVAHFLTEFGGAGIIKTRTLGYDGKGQLRVTTDDLTSKKEQITALLTQPCILEGLVDFAEELSLILARGTDGTLKSYPLVSNVHDGGILRESFSCAPVPDQVCEEAQKVGYAIAEALDYVGVLAIELFRTSHGILVNELAPRVHNSGHWSIEGAVTSQFENQLRAVAGFPLGSCEPVGYSWMYNILGSHPPRKQVLRIAGAHLHFYGKQERPQRKLGHITVVATSREQLNAKRQEILTALSS